jgi:hypothetical protein
MRSRLVILAALVLAAASQAAPALANDAATCTNAADISWEVDRSDHRVRTIIVEVDGCDGGELVGIQLITEDGDVPPSAPLVGEAWEGTATFDLMDTGLYVAPITGVRVFLELSGGEQVTYQITVDRRFFSSAGSEQVGLRQLTVLNVPLGGSYVVPGAPNRYTEVLCDQVGYEPEDVVGEGSGTFDELSASGRHITCFQQDPGTPGGRPPAPGGPGSEQPIVIPPDDASSGDGDPSDVLDEGHDPGSSDLHDPEDTEDTGVLGEVIDRRGDRVLGRLAMTGSDPLVAVAIGLMTVGIGLGLLRRRRA